MSTVKANLLSGASKRAVVTGDLDVINPTPRPTTPIPARRAWPINEAAYLLGISRVSIYELIKEGKLTLTKIAGRSVILDSEIVRLTTVSTTTEAA